MPYSDPAVVVSSGARTASGASGVINPDEMGETISLLVSVTAVSGTSPSLTVSVEWSNDGTNWATPETADTFAAMTAAINRVKAFERKALFYRVVWTISGTTPSFTFAVTEYVTS